MEKLKLAWKNASYYLFVAFIVLMIAGAFGGIEQSFSCVVSDRSPTFTLLVRVSRDVIFALILIAIFMMAQFVTSFVRLMIKP